MEFDDDHEHDHEDQDDEMEDIPTTQPGFDSLDNPSSRKSGSGGGGYIRYRECLKNHAIGIGGHAVDGCGEFMPAGEDGSIDALKCAACNCHRNFHRKENNSDQGYSYQQQQQPYYHHHHHQFSSYRPASSGYLYLTGPPGQQRQLALPAVSGGREDDDTSNPSSSGGGGSGMKMKRFRTKFSQEQKEKMLGFAEKVGWTIQKHDEGDVEKFCAETGVRRQVLKVRDIYDYGDYLILVTTDRQSAFDRVLASIPFKGQVLNETSLWWFDRTQHITSNAVVSVPDKNVTIAKKCSVFPVEFVVRGFVTGSTDTSLWTVYNKGQRNYCGNVLPDGLVKNQKLSSNIITPTTKAASHDVPVTPAEIIEHGLMTQADYDEASRKALSLFEYGQRVALEHGVILVDTKYEFGKGEDGSVLLIDEVHTPDSSRYWIAQSYEERFHNGLEPENVDKEFLRLWFKDNCNPYEDKVLPSAPEELVCELSWRYIFLYETITNSRFEVPLSEEPIHDRISRNVETALASLK